MTFSPWMRLIRLHKPIGILLLLWPTLWALWLASGGFPTLTLLFIFTAGVVLMRSAGCAINDIADRHIDGHVQRTKDRPLATGELSVLSAALIASALALSAFALVLRCNHLTVGLAVVGGLLAFIYPYLKRVTHWPQLGLGLAFGWGVPMAFAAVQNRVPTIAWVLYAAAIVWPLMYDTLYAMVDRPDDVVIGVKSTAILFGGWDRVVIALLQGVFLALMAWVGRMAGLGVAYDLSLIIAAGLFLYQQKRIAHREPADCFKAFLNNHWVGLVIFVGIVLSLGVAA